MEAYTYLVTHNETGKLYYGCRKSTTFDLWEKYFTSSKVIKRMLLLEGTQAFSVQLRQTFDSYQLARQWETNFLQRVQAVTNPKFFNQSVSGARVPTKDSASEIQRRASISTHMKLRWKDPKFRALFTTPENKEHCRQMSKLRTHWPKPRFKKSPPTSYYKKIMIIRNGKTKIIHQNQLSAYRKCGWSAQ